MVGITPKVVFKTRLLLSSYDKDTKHMWSPTVKNMLATPIADHFNPIVEIIWLYKICHVPIIWPQKSFPKKDWQKIVASPHILHMKDDTFSYSRWMGFGILKDLLMVIGYLILKQNGWDLAESGWDLGEYGWDLDEWGWIRSSRIERASDFQRQSFNIPGINPSNFRQSGIWEATKEVVLRKCIIKYISKPDYC